jgi:hypothetical protein
MVPTDKGLPCGNQIEEGSSIGTVMLANGPAVGHKKCTDAFYARKMQAERDKRENMVKIAKQGSSGLVGPYEDAILNPSPLVKPEKTALSEPASELHELTTEEQVALEDYKQQILQKRSVSISFATRAALGDFLTSLMVLKGHVETLVNEYDKVVAERDEARSQRDTARATGTLSP